MFKKYFREYKKGRERLVVTEKGNWAGLKYESKMF